MKVFDYLKYFFFIAINWNLKLAWFTIRHEISGEKKYGINTTRINNLKNLPVKGNLENAEIYQGASYYLLESLFAYLQSINANYHILDLGCGKGKVLEVAPWYGFTKITGIEFSDELCAIARKNITPVQRRFPEKILNVIHANAADYEIE